MRRFAVLTLALLWPLSAQSLCSGQDLIAALPAQDLAPLRAAADAVPYASGNAWMVTKGEEVLYILGTMHLDDPRHAAILQTMLPWLRASDLLLVEAGPEEQALLKARISKEPTILINTEGPTLPEVLSKADWQALSVAMTVRGVPPFMAAKFKPWYITVLLSLPPCALTAGMPLGLDQQLMDQAAAADIPTQALEPYDTLFSVFETSTIEEQIKMLALSVAADTHSEDMHATMIESYFAEDTRLSWEFTKYWTKSLPGYDPVSAGAELQVMEDRLMIGRNEAWIAVIEEAVTKQSGPIFIAFGALHLAGDRGVLNLLGQRGFTLTRLLLP